MSRKRDPAAHIDMVCPSCQQKRVVRRCDWTKRKSDLCRPCSNRNAVGLPASTGNSGKGTRLYNIWRGMRQRCGLVAGGHERDLLEYRDRGITVFPEWATDFCMFESWALSNGYGDELVIDRKNNDEGYYPSNCRWVSVTDSNRNKRTVLPITTVKTIRACLRQGMKHAEISDSLKVPIDKIGRISQNKTFKDIA